MFLFIKKLFKKKPTVFIMVGPPGSGKSYRAKLLDAVYISQDEQGKGHMVLFMNALKGGRDIVVDRMNFNKEQRSRYIKPAKKAGFRIVIALMNVDDRDGNKQRALNRCNHPTIKNRHDFKRATNTFYQLYEAPSWWEGKVLDLSKIKLKDIVYL